MLLRGMLSDEESEILDRSKEARYGLEDATRIHKGYELGVIVKEYSRSYIEISNIVKKNNLNSTDGRHETSFRISTEVNEKIERIAKEAGVSKIAVVRSLLYIRNCQLNSLETEDSQQVILSACEWNINHRNGTSNKGMPEWVIEYLLKQDYDIIILTECSEKVSNWVQERKRLEEKYYVFSSSNYQIGQNDITIAIKKGNISVISTQSFFSNSYNVPNHLEVRCKCKETGKLFSVVGMRIRTVDSDEEKCIAFQLVLSSIRDVDRVIIGGDFNNYRRSCPPRRWNIEKLYEISENEGFIVYTPDGASFGRDVKTDDKRCFALDHFILKGISIDKKELKYKRDFTEIDSSIYKWGRHFQAEWNWDNPGNSIEDPYPDHAILEGTFKI